MRVRTKLGVVAAAVAAVGLLGSLTVPSDASADPGVKSGRYDNTSSAISYSGTWETLESDQDLGEDIAVAKEDGASAEIVFIGTGVKWLARTGPFWGRADVFLDGERVADVDLYRSESRYAQAVFTRTGLKPGTHTLRIERTGAKDADSPTSNVQIDAIDVLDSTPPRKLTEVDAQPGRLGTEVTWLPSRSKDVASYRVYRTGDGRTRQLITPAGFSNSTFLDITAKPGATYTYSVTAVDYGGNASRAASTAKVDALKSPTPSRRYDDCPKATTTVSNMKSLQKAVKKAGPGSVIRLEPGTYSGYLEVTKSGSSDRPLWICGPRDAVLTRSDPSEGFAVHIEGAKHVVLSGMTITEATQAVTISSSANITVSDLMITKTGQEAIKLRYDTTDSYVIGNVIRDTGLVKPEYGEGIYVGTSPARWCEYTDCEPDRSDRNSILDNSVAGTTADPIEAKQGTANGRIENNEIDGASLTDVTSLIYVKGNNWLVRGNTGWNSPGDAFIGNFDYDPNPGWGKNNVFVANTADVPAEEYGVAVREGYGNLVACSNEVTNDDAIATNTECRR